MALTRDCKETIQARVQHNAGSREALLREGIENSLSGDVETGKIILSEAPLGSGVSFATKGAHEMHGGKGLIASTVSTEPRVRPNPLSDLLRPSPT